MNKERFQTAQACGESFYRVYDMTKNENMVVMTAEEAEHGEIIRSVWTSPELSDAEKIACMEAVQDYQKTGKSKAEALVF